MKTHPFDLLLSVPVAPLVADGGRLAPPTARGAGPVARRPARPGSLPEPACPPPPAQLIVVGLLLALLLGDSLSALLEEACDCFVATWAARPDTPGGGAD